MTVTLGMLLIGLLLLVGRIAWLLIKNGLFTASAAGGGEGDGKGAKGKAKGAIKTLKRHWKELIPFGVAMITMALAGACLGGWLGRGVGWLRIKAGDAGDWFLNEATGTDTVKAHASASVLLTPWGTVVMLLLIMIAVMAWKAASDTAKRELLGGAICGLAMGPFAGAAMLIPVTNWAGEQTVKQLFYAVI